LLLEDLKAAFDLSYLFISHDLAVVESISDRVAVMYFGEVVEIGSAKELFTAPRHDYTKRLIASAPRLQS
jgi:peptide/nickel transport system ATP-binding protein